MLAGVYPDRRHDNRDWLPADDGRAALAGRVMPFRAVCLYVKCDWAEMVHSLGFFSWKHASSPCPMCFCDSQSMFSYSGFNPVSFPHPRKTLAHYLTECGNCEICLVLTAADIREIRPLLGFDKHRKVFGGRVLLQDIPRLGLQKGDLLAPSRESPNIFSRLTRCPSLLCFGELPILPW